MVSPCKCAEVKMRSMLNPERFRARPFICKCIVLGHSRPGSTGDTASIALAMQRVVEDLWQACAAGVRRSFWKPAP